LIYVDTSILLAQLLAEDRKPTEALWRETLISSRLTEYETWVRINALGLASSHGETTRQLLSRVSILELSPLVLKRALEPFSNGTAAGPVQVIEMETELSGAERD
jgi:hypothetical protein